MTEISSFVVEEGVDLKAEKSLPKLKLVLAELMPVNPGKLHHRPKIRISKDGCWTWLWALSKKGYGFTNLKKRIYQSHKFFYERIEGKVPDGLEIDHLCFNRACVNPAHMRTVTHAENIKARDALTAKLEKCKAIGMMKHRCGWRAVKEGYCKYHLNPLAVSVLNWHPTIVEQPWLGVRGLRLFIYTPTAPSMT